MKLWLIERTDIADYDEFKGFVIRAETEEAARAIADSRRGDETNDSLGGRPDFWAVSKCVTCVELAPDGPPGVVLASYRAG